MSGRFLYVGDEKLWLRGVTYGTFLPTAVGDDGYDPVKADQDFARMAAVGINALRVYTVPPVWVLELAQRHGLWVAVDLPWEEHITFLDRPGLPREIGSRLAATVRAVAGHPALLGFSIGNEIPARIVRWHGASAVESFLEALADEVHAADPGALVTYVNYPSTEYLRVRSTDYDSWNVYLEDDADFVRYVARLQNLAPDRPVVITELGADSRRKGTDFQAALLRTQVAAAFAAGSAGTFVFAWTDEWARSGVAVDDWDFGLTTREREPKPALAALEAAYAQVPFPDDLAWPRISVVCCSYNGAAVISDCLDALARLDYPDYEVIVIDDGSTDETAAIARGYDVRLMSQENQGLSAARNAGLRLASGEITAYIDDDAYPDPDWLRYIAWVYLGDDVDGAGGPNLPPPGDGEMADLVALAPGGPNHVLISDTVAEHVPGCNSTYRTEALRAIGGYDTRFRTAGDDVDVGWRIQERGGRIGFSAGATVWHHRRGTARGYLRQQRGYGYAEALLERKWPSRFNRLGHVSWPGQLYGPGARPAPLTISSIYGGSWGSAAFQSMYERGSGWTVAPIMPDWWLAVGGLSMVGLLGLAWPPLLWAWPVVLLMVGASVAVSLAVAVDGLRYRRLSTAERLRRTALLTGLVLGQSLYRTRGRLDGGLHPLRRRGISGWTVPRRVELEEWSEEWQSMEARLREVEQRLIGTGAAVRRGGACDAWDLEVRTGAFASARVVGTIEEHGHGNQMVRWRAVPRSHPGTPLLLVMVGIGALTSVGDQAFVAGAALMLLTAALATLAILHAGWAVALAGKALRSSSLVPDPVGRRS